MDSVTVRDIKNAIEGLPDDAQVMIDVRLDGPEPIYIPATLEDVGTWEIEELDWKGLQLDAVIDLDDLASADAQPEED